jgi:vacuolar-type H+-ATPase subunit F/Vma7
MEDDIIVIGDERDTAGFRLAGFAVRCPGPEQVPQAVEQAAHRAMLIVLSRAAADALGRERLTRLRQADKPLVAVLPDLAAPAVDEPFMRQMRAVLGIDG